MERRVRGVERVIRESAIFVSFGFLMVFEVVNEFRGCVALLTKT